MKKLVTNFISLCLIILILLLVMNRLNIVNFSTTLNDIFSFLTLILIVVSSFSVILIGSSKLDKFINSIIFLSTIVGGVYFIMNPQLNIFILVCLGTSLTYSLKDMLYKKKA